MYIYENKVPYKFNNEYITLGNIRKRIIDCYSRSDKLLGRFIQRSEENEADFIKRVTESNFQQYDMIFTNNE